MKRIASVLLGACLLTGCARHYDMVLTNGEHVINVTRPVLDRENSVYTYKDVAGREHYTPSGRVIEIKPHSKKDDTYFSGH